MNQTATAPEPIRRHKSAESFERANSEYDSGHYADALDLFNQALSYGLSNEVVYNNKGAALDALGRNAEATECYSKATQLNGDYELAWHNLGNSLFIREAYSDAARAYSKAASLKADRMENWSGLAACYTKLEKLRRARSAIAALSRFAQTDPTVLLLQSDMYFDAGFTDLSMASCREFISRKPDSVEGYARLGSAQHETGEYGKAIETFEKALKIDPGNKELWNNLGYTCFCAGFLQRAVECFDKAIEIDPVYKHAWYNKGYAYHGADILEEAVKCYTSAIAIDPVDRVLWNNLGNALYNLGRYGESIPRFVEAIKVDPDYEIAWNNIGNALEKMGLYKEAIPYHDRSLEISPDFDYALYAKGVCKSHTDDPEGGYDLVLESLDINPNYDEAWKARSRIAAQLGRLDEALISIEESLALNPEFDEGWTERGEILVSVGEAEAGQASFEMALRCLEGARPDTVSGVQALVRRGEVLARLGRYREALANLESVAIAGKLGSVSIPKTLELRRYLNMWSLPEALRNIAERSEDPAVVLAYAAFLIDAGEPDKALVVLDRLSSNDGGTLRQLLRAKAQVILGDAGAKAQFKQLSKVEDSSGIAERLEAEVLESRGEYKSAANAYAKALKFRPSDAAVALGLARASLKAGDGRTALSAADHAIGIDPEDWEPYRIKADAFKHLGERGKAQVELNEAKARLGKTGLADNSSGGGED